VRYLIDHDTRLTFSEPVREHQVELRLVPPETEFQRTLESHLECEPAAELREHVDAFGNRVHRLSLVGAHDRLRVRLHAEVETRLENPFAFVPLAPAEEREWLARRLRGTPRLHEWILHRSASVPDLSRTDEPPPPRAEERPLLENVQAAIAWMRGRFAYDPSATDTHAPLAIFLEKRAGVCQDFAHLLVAIVRHWGVPARYVTGYVDPGTTGEGATEATHAWAEVLIPGAGWRGFDATHDLMVNDRYVTVAVGRDSRDAAPVRGAFKGDDPGDPPEVHLRVARQRQQ
jgi:transglutaminase-like putative cysteine protease